MTAPEEEHQSNNADYGNSKKLVINQTGPAIKEEERLEVDEERGEASKPSVREEKTEEEEEEEEGEVLYAKTATDGNDTNKRGPNDLISNLSSLSSTVY